jgi:RNA polymerase sigma-70 factor (ECF subfamily)
MKFESDEAVPTRWTLIKRLKNWDDQESWREFFDLYWKLIYSAARKSGLTDSEAEEVVQTTVISVCKNIHKFKADPAAGSFKGWLRKVTESRIIDQVRKRRPETLARAHARSGPNPDDTPSTPTEERIPDPNNFLEAIWEQEWRQNLIEQAVERLKARVNARHYQVFHLLVFRETPPKQVAKIAGVSVEQVYLIKHRVSEAFEAALKEVETKTTCTGG